MRLAAILIAAGVLLTGLTAAGAAAWRAAYNAGADAERAKCAAVRQAIEDAVEAAEKRAAGDLEQVRAQGDQALARVLGAVRSQRVYVECMHTPEALRAINEALTGRPAGRAP